MIYVLFSFLVRTPRASDEALTSLVVRACPFFVPLSFILADLVASAPSRLYRFVNRFVDIFLSEDNGKFLNPIVNHSQFSYINMV